jgi:hypothetical protein
MIRIAVYEYVCRTSRGQVRVPTFKPGDTAGHRLVGHLVAPDGAELREVGGVLKLKVPKPGRRGESWLMTASDAHSAAIASADGLSWDFGKVGREAVTTSG